MTCPACIAHGVHSPDERACYHPLAGHGYQEGQGWSGPQAEQAHIAEVRAKNQSQEKSHVAHA
jgi:hypothetical protein